MPIVLIAGSIAREAPTGDNEQLDAQLCEFIHRLMPIQKVHTDWKDTIGATFNQSGSLFMRSSRSWEGVSSATDSSMRTTASPCRHEYSTEEERRTAYGVI